MPEKTKIHLKNGGGGSFDRSNNGNSNGRPQHKMRTARAESMTKGAAGNRQRAAPPTDSFDRYPPKNEIGGGGGRGVKSKSATGKSRLSNASSRCAVLEVSHTALPNTVPGPGI